MGTHGTPRLLWCCLGHHRWGRTITGWTNMGSPAYGYPMASRTQREATTSRVIAVAPESRSRLQRTARATFSIFHLATTTTDARKPDYQRNRESTGGEVKLDLDSQVRY